MLRAAALLAAAALAAAQQPAAAPWRPHRLSHPAVGPRHTAAATPAANAAPATPVPAAGSRKPRVGIAPPGVELDQALASARALQPGPRPSRVVSGARTLYAPSDASGD